VGYGFYLMLNFHILRTLILPNRILLNQKGEQVLYQSFIILKILYTPYQLRVCLISLSKHGESNIKKWAFQLIMFLTAKCVVLLSW
jgi:hypothetical protein